MPLSVERLPDRDGLGGKAAVGEADDEGRTRPQDAQDAGKDLHGALQILDANTAQGGIAAGGLQGKDGVAVQVLHKAATEPGVGLELLGVHASADHLGEGHLGRQMADPARHQIQHNASGWQEGTVEAGERMRCRLVNVSDEPGRGVEDCVVAAVLLREGFGR